MPPPLLSASRQIARAVLGVSAGVSLAFGVIAGGCASTTATTASESSVRDRLADAAVDTEAWRELGYRLDWHVVPFVADGQRIREVRGDQDIVAVQETGSTITVYDTATGRALLTNQLATPLSRYVGIERVGDRLYIVGNSDISIVNLEQGTLDTRVDAGVITTGRPVLMGDSLVMCGQEGDVVSVLPLPSPGFELWRFGVRDPINIDPVQVGGVVVVASRSGNIVMLSGSDGAVVGRDRIFEGPGAQLAAGDGVAVVASLDRSIYAYDPVDGQRIWRFLTTRPLRSTPAIVQGTVIITTADRGLIGINTATGDLKWSKPDEVGEVVAEIDGRALISDGSSLRLVDPDDGSVIASAQVDGIASIEQATDSEALYIISESNTVARLVPSR
ncbi:MAG: PQQ-binding-like beta-propeller repeat protein [Planctomycetota bacterium]